MAEYLRKRAKPVTMAAAWMLLFMLAGGGRAQSQVLNDPTRPPASLGSQTDQAAEKMKAEPELQSVLISPTRRVAVIDGQTVALGETFREARVVRITEGEVVLRNGQDLQVLKLFPKFEKRRKSERSNNAPADAGVKVR
jgi:MSHA biogenesis protein MshK